MDDDTLQFYRRNAEAYADWAKAPSLRLKGFLALLPPGGSILELGCGAGNHSADMLAAGFKLRATDGSPEMAEIASRKLGHPVETMLFDELNENEAYDGVWASACLLHVPRDELAGILQRIRRALKPEGIFGCRRPTPPQVRGTQSRPAPARSRVSTKRRQRCCI